MGKIDDGKDSNHYYRSIFESPLVEEVKSEAPSHISIYRKALYFSQRSTNQVDQQVLPKTKQFYYEKSQCFCLEQSSISEFVAEAERYAELEAIICIEYLHQS